MDVKPILFNTGMVRALLENRKTVTRRVMIPQPPNGQEFLRFNEDDKTVEFQDGNITDPINFIYTYKVPFWPGDVIYVRETWQHLYIPERVYIYKADSDGSEELATNCKGEWRPSIHMPRKAARIFLRVTDVRVERLQNINERGPLSAVSEGFINDIDLRSGTGKSATKHFAECWDSTIRPKGRALYGWNVNPWVWVIGFSRREKPI